MGEAKRRKELLGDKYGKEPYILPWVPVTKTQAQQFLKWSMRGAWVGIGILVVIWVTVMFVGPSLGWWEIQG